MTLQQLNDMVKLIAVRDMAMSNVETWFEAVGLLSAMGVVVKHWWTYDIQAPEQEQQEIKKQLRNFREKGCLVITK